jgi:hypothetical protein
MTQVDTAPKAELLRRPPRPRNAILDKKSMRVYLVVSSTLDYCIISSLWAELYLLRRFRPFFLSRNINPLKFVAAVAQAVDLSAVGQEKGSDRK